MVRTRADAGATKVSAAKAPRKVLSGGAGSSSAGSSSSVRTPGKDRYSGGNSYNPQPTPDWQKGIGNFFKATPKPATTTDDVENAAEGSSSSSFAKNGVIEDDDD